MSMLAEPWIEEGKRHGLQQGSSRLEDFRVALEIAFPESRKLRPRGSPRRRRGDQPPRREPGRAKRSGSFSAPPCPHGDTAFL